MRGSSVREVVRGASRRTATLAAALASAAAIAYLAFFLFGPIYTTCSFGPIGPDQTVSGPGACRAVGWLEMTLTDTSPVRDFRALWFLGAWTLAPVVALIATRSASSGVALGIVAAAFVMELSSIISMGGGFVYAILCGPLLAIALVALMVAFVRDQMG
jgi:hypothetical protein